MGPEECVQGLMGLGDHYRMPMTEFRILGETAAHLRRLAATETALHNLHGYVVGLEEEVKRLRAALGAIADGPAAPWARALAFEALEPVEGDE